MAAAVPLDHLGPAPSGVWHFIILIIFFSCSLARLYCKHAVVTLYCVAIGRRRVAVTATLHLVLDCRALSLVVTSLLAEKKKSAAVPQCDVTLEATISAQVNMAASPAVLRL